MAGSLAATKGTRPISAENAASASSAGRAGAGLSSAAR